MSARAAIPGPADRFLLSLLLLARDSAVAGDAGAAAAAESAARGLAEELRRIRGRCGAPPSAQRLPELHALP